MGTSAYLHKPEQKALKAVIRPVGLPGVWTIVRTGAGQLQQPLGIDLALYDQSVWIVR